MENKIEDENIRTNDYQIILSKEELLKDMKILHSPFQENTYVFHRDSLFMKILSKYGKIYKRYEKYVNLDKELYYFDQYKISALRDELLLFQDTSKKLRDFNIRVGNVIVFDDKYGIYGCVEENKEYIVTGIFDYIISLEDTENRNTIWIQKNSLYLIKEFK